MVVRDGEVGDVRFGGVDFALLASAYMYSVHISIWICIFLHLVSSVAISASYMNSLLTTTGINNNHNIRVDFIAVDDCGHEDLTTCHI